MKRHRVIFEIQMDIPDFVPATEAWAKYVGVCGGQHVNIGTPKVISDTPLPEELLPYEIRRSEQLAVRKMIADVLTKNHLPFIARVSTYWESYDNKRVDYPMSLELTLDSKSYTKLQSLIPTSGGEKWATKEGWGTHLYGVSISFKIENQEISHQEWNQPKNKISSIGDPELKGLVAFMRNRFGKELELLEPKNVGTKNES